MVLVRARVIVATASTGDPERVVLIELLSADVQSKNSNYQVGM